MSGKNKRNKPPTTLGVGVVQVDAGQDKDHNLKAAARLTQLCVERGAKLVVLPEVFAWRGNMKIELAQAEPLRGRIYKALKSMAKKNGVCLVGGSYLETGRHPGGKAHNTMVAFDENGFETAIYRKLHLFDIDRATTVTMTESATREAGEAPALANLAGVNVGLGICYDLRFPELFRHYALRGADGFCVGAAFTTATGKDHWHLLVRARAVENQSFMAASNQYGTTGGTPNYGHSCIVDAWGNVLADAGEGEGCAVAFVDLAAQRRLREDFPVLRHCRDLWREGLGSSPDIRG